MKQRIINMVGIGLLAGLMLVSSGTAWATTYGNGTYGNCPYNTGCASSSQSSTQAQPAQPEAILLNDFQDFFQPGGKTFDLVVNQVVYFDVAGLNGTERHSITINEIGPDYVVFTIASTPIQDRLYVGQSKQYDVTSDNKDDIKIALNSITDGKANMTFFALNQSVSNPSQNQAAPQASSSLWWLWLSLSILAIVAALVVFFILWKRRKDRHSDITTNSS
ncbi:MAG TPA: hypothetical protein VLE72_03785 [Candidatus Saccharimonadales bacterium]|nr:hypothetical protein [Candidatus Saccharimonadales bacterium]